MFWNWFILLWSISSSNKLDQDIRDRKAREAQAAADELENRLGYPNPVVRTPPPTALPFLVSPPTVTQPVAPVKPQAIYARCIKHFPGWSCLRNDILNGWIDKSDPSRNILVGQTVFAKIINPGTPQAIMQIDGVQGPGAVIPHSLFYQYFDIIS